MSHAPNLLPPNHIHNCPLSQPKMETLIESNCLLSIDLFEVSLLYFVELITYSLTKLFSIKSFSTEKIYEGNFIELKVLDKISSKNYKINIKIGEEKIFKNISIKPLKCKNSQFDDSPEIIAYLQVKDLKNVGNDEVFVFNGWTFSSSPTLRPFDHPVYDLWLTGCENI